MATNKAVTPAELCFEGNMAENWEFFKQKFNIYLKASKQGDEDEEMKLFVLLNLIGDKGLRIYNTFKFEENESKNDCSIVLKKFDDKFIPMRNPTYERYKFFTRNKATHETYDHYVTALRELANTCEFGALADSLIREKLILGIQEIHIKDRLLREINLTLQKAVEICKVAEVTAQQLQKISQNNNHKMPEEINMVQKTKNLSKYCLSQGEDQQSRTIQRATVYQDRASPSTTQGDPKIS
ncbi:hypothetical protein RN001_002004 [Aquatica leii]|uniref:Gag protein n=1 Tax=Aquatica leii TaxID=1421715 RepID=A0AAN7SR34_9COLE|nr:hypothetical protein RN001_002004 [Aquatica leii]